VNLAMSIATSSREVAAGSSDDHGLAVVGAIELDVWLATTTCWFWMCGWLLQPAGCSHTIKLAISISRVALCVRVSTRSTLCCLYMRLLIKRHRGTAGGSC
jgi:hypothetical protein